MGAPNPTKGGYEMIAFYNKTREEIAMCRRAKNDALARGRKCFVNIPEHGTHNGKLCLWLHKKHIKKGDIE